MNGEQTTAGQGRLFEWWQGRLFNADPYQEGPVLWPGIGPELLSDDDAWALLTPTAGTRSDLTARVGLNDGRGL